jgi:hypothetical protein
MSDPRTGRELYLEFVRGALTGWFNRSALLVVAASAVWQFSTGDVVWGLVAVAVGVWLVARPPTLIAVWIFLRRRRKMSGQ